MPKKKSHNLRDIIDSKRYGTSLEHETYLRYLSENLNKNLLDQIKYSSEIARKQNQPVFKLKNIAKFRTKDS
jgi:hypothetical protein